MGWVHGTWQCGRCKLKLGCCEGEPQSGFATGTASPNTLGGSTHPDAEPEAPAVDNS